MFLPIFELAVEVFFAIKEWRSEIKVWQLAATA